MNFLPWVTPFPERDRWSTWAYGLTCFLCSGSRDRRRQRWGAYLSAGLDSIDGWAHEPSWDRGRAEELETDGSLEVELIFI